MVLFKEVPKLMQWERWESPNVFTKSNEMISREGFPYLKESSFVTNCIKGGANCILAKK